MALAKPHPRSTAVLVNELHAGRFEGSADCQIVSGRHRGLKFCEFGTADGGKSQSSFSREIGSAPPKQSTRSTDLRTG
jgi:hypothetical protein